MADFLPIADLPLRAWLRPFRDAVTAEGASYDVDPGEATDFAAGVADFDNALTAQAAARQALRAATAAKNAARGAVKAKARSLARRLQAHPSMLDEGRARFGLPSPDRTPTPASRPVTRPLLRVELADRWEHRLRFSDEATPTRRAKPKGARGLEVWRAFGPVPPASPADFTYVGTMTASTNRLLLDPARAGQTAHYMARWINSRGETGPWSETVSATVAG